MPDKGAAMYYANNYLDLLVTCVILSLLLVSSNVRLAREIRKLNLAEELRLEEEQEEKEAQDEKEAATTKAGSKVPYPAFLFVDADTTTLYDGHSEFLLFSEMVHERFPCFDRVLSTLPTVFADLFVVIEEIFDALELAALNIFDAFAPLKTFDAFEPLKTALLTGGATSFPMLAEGVLFTIICLILVTLSAGLGDMKHNKRDLARNA